MALPEYQWGVLPPCNSGSGEKKPLNFTSVMFRVYARFFKKGFQQGVEISVHTLRSQKWFQLAS